MGCISSGEFRVAAHCSLDEGRPRPPLGEAPSDPAAYGLDPSAAEVALGTAVVGPVGTGRVDYEQARQGAGRSLGGAVRLLGFPRLGFGITRELRLGVGRRLEGGGAGACRRDPLLFFGR